MGASARRLRVRASRRSAVLLAALAVACVALGSPPRAAAASRHGAALTVATTGLPAGQPASILIAGPGLHRRLTAARTTLAGLRAGRYVLSVSSVVIARSRRAVSAGARAYPARRRVSVTLRGSRRMSLTVRYAAIVNPDVRQAPPVLSLTGEPRDPTAIVIAASSGRPAVGAILTSGPTGTLPLGLLAKVTAVTRSGSTLHISLTAVPVSDAVPELSFTGSLPLSPAAGAPSESTSTDVAQAAAVRGRASSVKCKPPKLVKLGAHLDSVELREAFLGTWPPQVKLTLAVRTTESLGIAVAAAGVNCDFDLHELGPYTAAIPAGPIVIPVYATVPLKAGVHINGTLQAGTVNLASTTVAHAAAGWDETAASLQQQGSNVWISGVLALTGSVQLSASIGVQAGIGLAKGANVHVEAGFGPEFDWSTGHDCEVLLDLGSLSAGVTILGKPFNTPSYTPFKVHLWHGCETPPPTGPAGGGSPKGTPIPPTPPTPPKSLCEASGCGSAPIPLTGATALSDGANGTVCALISGGSIDCWGGNDIGQLGDGVQDNLESNPTPVQVADVSTATQLASGFPNCAVLSSGRVDCWGAGDLGNGTTTPSTTPSKAVTVSGITTATSVGSIGIEGLTTCASLADGTVDCWGSNYTGALGSGRTGYEEQDLTPTPVPGLSGVASVTAGGAFCALLKTGHIDCWGRNEDDQLGAGAGAGQELCAGGTEKYCSTKPLEVQGIGNAIAVSAGQSRACALLATRQVECWGEIAAGHPNETTPTPALVPGLANAVSIAVGNYASCALLADGQDVCWGAGVFGEFGDGAFTESATPVPASIPTATAIAAGYGQACAVVAAGAVDCWGGDLFGQLGNGIGGTAARGYSAVPVSVAEVAG
jgi:alpha-tubulin suppressor-like RCC1 family protein